LAPRLRRLLRVAGDQRAGLGALDRLQRRERPRRSRPLFGLLRRSPTRLLARVLRPTGGAGTAGHLGQGLPGRPRLGSDFGNPNRAEETEEEVSRWGSSERRGRWLLSAAVLALIVIAAIANAGQSQPAPKPNAKTHPSPESATTTSTQHAGEEGPEGLPHPRD